MKRVIPFLTLLFVLVILNCEDSAVTGTDDVYVYDDVTITVDTTYVFGDDYRARGTVTNNGNTTITPIWYIEGSFFRDSQRNFKFGGNNTSFNFSLGPDQSTGWQINFSASQYPASENPDFAVGEFRVYKNESPEN